MRLGTVVSDRKHYGGETRGIARKLCTHTAILALKTVEHDIGGNNIRESRMEHAREI